jgi:uncharacterized protein (DUF697 family)/predicted GTPase
MAKSMIPRAWQWLWDRASPKVDPRQIEAILDKARQGLPTPVFWLLGKTEQGKTSIVRALTGRNDAEIGKGFRACTRTASVYAYPDEQACFLRFLDTRGLGETGYDPSEDLRAFAGQSHILIVVLKAMDHAQQDALAALRAIRRERPHWPVIVCQTALHEGYVGQADHVVPYPFAAEPFPAAVPHELARSLHAQRAWFADQPVRFVPLDFTYADHNQRVCQPADYGLDALWEAIEAAVPLGLREMVRNNIAIRKRLHDAYFDTAHSHILVYAGAAGGAGAIPVPYIDVPIVLSLQAKLFHTVATIYGQPLSTAQMATIASGLGVGYLARFGLRELAKLIPLPGVGSVVSGAFAAASTYALGIALCEYFGHVLDGNVPDARMFRGWYQEAFAAAKPRFHQAPPQAAGEGTTP